MLAMPQSTEKGSWKDVESHAFAMACVDRDMCVYEISFTATKDGLFARARTEHRKRSLFARAPALTHGLAQ